MLKLFRLNNEYGATLRLAVPIILSQVGQIITQLADNIMVGRLGTLPLAAVSFGGTVSFILLMVSESVNNLVLIYERSSFIKAPKYCMFLLG